MRRGALLVAASASLAFAGTAAATTDANAQRARVSEAALVVTFRSAHPGLYRETAGGSLAYVWPYSQAVAAAVAIAALPGATRAERRAAGDAVARLEHYRQGLVYGSMPPHGTVFVDDNEWIAFDLLDWSAVAHDAHALAVARRLYAFAVEEWDGGAANPCAGGVYWTRRRPNRDRATVTTAGAALLGLRLAALPGAPPSYAWWSGRMLDWLDRCLARSDGLYANSIGPDGRVDWAVWSYNQGLVVGALTLAARASGDPLLLARAEQLAEASLPFLDPAALGREPPPFVAVLARNLLLLGRTDGDPRWRAAVQAYADAAWTSARDPKTGVFRFGRGRACLLEQAALTQIYALLAADPVTAGP